MPGFTDGLSSLGWSLLRIVLLVVVAIVAFYLTVFVVSTGAGLAGYSPDGNFVVLAASLLVVAVILAGGFSPQVTVSSQGDAPVTQGEEEHDPAFD